MADIDARAAQNRARMPHTAAFIDEIRRNFPGAKVQWARENGIEVGKRSPDGGLRAPAAAASPTLEKFLLILRKEFFQRYHRAARAGDDDWGDYVSAQGAARWDDFCGRTFDDAGRRRA